MYQQINFYQDEFRATEQIFCATTLLKTCAAALLVMLLTSVLAIQEMSSVERELEIVRNQDVAAAAQLHKLQPAIAAVSGKRTWVEQLDDATRLLAEKEQVLKLVLGSTLGNTQGFSRYLSSLTRQDTDGLWLTQISLSALGDKTRLEGQALRAELVPAYLQTLADEPPFATQRFQQFQINGPTEPNSDKVTFSMNSESQLIAELTNPR
ncbi:MAG: hypothetical protein QGH93_03805 [Gammaproteobacteria bacterium]|jgi:hypothetical protein|nr:hypothetical protein [Chromatiales bacterium]MDP6673962.1 hypothetical protein [Gammaproteobacteria bacterium]